MKKYSIIYSDPPWRQEKGGKKKVRPKSSGEKLDYQVISLDEIERRLGKRKFKRFCKCSCGSTRPLVPVKDIKIPKPDDWVYYYDYTKFCYLDSLGK